MTPANYPEAIVHFQAALKSDPRYVEARVQLAGTLARSGRPGEALEQYADALRADPTNGDAAFGRAMSFVRLRRYTDARDALADGMKNHPDHAMFAHALARLLAAAPDDRVRDGRGALKLIDQLVKGPQSLELAENDGDGAGRGGAVPGGASRAARCALGGGHGQFKLPAAEQRIDRNLRLYEGGKPCRVPFADDELP